MCWVKGGDFNREKEKDLRARAWWKGNDRRRGIDGIKQNLSVEEQQNLQALIGILDPSDGNDRIMIAEINRELGNFEAAINLLKKPFPDELLKAASVIMDLARNQDSSVMEMKFES